MAATKTVKKERYIEAVGRRKTAIARVRLFEDAKQTFQINQRDLPKHFPTHELQAIVTDAFQKAGVEQPFLVSALVYGGGITAQAEAIRLGIARALVAFDNSLRTPLKRAGLLKRDPRVKERKKFGLRKARRAPQWSKR